MKRNKLNRITQIQSFVSRSEWITCSLRREIRTTPPTGSLCKTLRRSYVDSTRILCRTSMQFHWACKRGCPSLGSGLRGRQKGYGFEWPLWPQREIQKRKTKGVPSFCILLLYWYDPQDAWTSVAMGRLSNLSLRSSFMDHSYSGNTWRIAISVCRLWLHTNHIKVSISWGIHWLLVPWNDWFFYIKRWRERWQHVCYMGGHRGTFWRSMEIR